VHVQPDSSFSLQNQARARAVAARARRIRSGVKAGALYAYPREKSIRRFMDQVRARTRHIPLKTQELIIELNPLLRGWGEYYSAPTSVSSFIASTAGLPAASGRIGTGVGGARAGRTCPQHGCTRVRTGQLVQLIPPLHLTEMSLRESCMRGKLHVQFERRTVASARARHLRPDNAPSTEDGTHQVVSLPASGRCVDVTQRRTRCRILFGLCCSPPEESLQSARRRVSSRSWLNV